MKLNTTIILAVLLSICSSLVLPATSTGGSISGIVTDAVTGYPISNTNVTVLNQGGTAVGSDTTDSEGKYQVTGIPPGNCYVQTNVSTNYINELYNNVSCGVADCDLSKGTLLAVNENVERTDINFALNKGLSISGKVTNAATQAPLSNVVLVIKGYGSGIVLKSAVSDINGNYSITGLIPGTYLVHTYESFSYVDEMYDNIVCQWCSWEDGTPIVLTDADRLDINFALDTGGTFSGTATDAITHQPIAYATISVRESRDGFIRTTITDSLGQYTSGALPPGTYFAAIKASMYLIEEYDNVPCQPYCGELTGTPIPVTLHTNTPGIDFAIEKGGTISGTVTDSNTNLPIPYTYVVINTANNLYAGYSQTNDSGTYTVGGFASGTYYARTADYMTAHGYIDKIYKDILCLPPSLCQGDFWIGTPISVIQKTDTGGIDFALSKGGSISGKTTDSVRGVSIPKVYLSVYNAKGDRIQITQSDNYGNYKVQGLGSGTYYVLADAWQYLSGLYNQMDCSLECVPLSGTPVVVGLGSDTPDINFSLTPSNSLYGDNFDDGSLSDWTEKGWYVDAEAATATTSRRTDATSPNFGGCGLCGFGTTMNVSAGGRISLIGWYTNNSNQVEVRLMQDKQKLLILQRAGAGQKRKATVQMNILPDTDYKVQAIYDGVKFRIIVDGQQIMTMDSIKQPYGIVKLRIKKGSASVATGAFQFVEVH